MNKLTFQEELLSDFEDNSNNEIENKDKYNNYNNETDSSVDSSVENEEIKIKQSNYNKKQNNNKENKENIKKRKLDNNEKKDINLTLYSNFLLKFLSNKKSQSIPPPPPDIPMNDDIIKEFVLSQKKLYSIKSKNNGTDSEIENKIDNQDKDQDDSEDDNDSYREEDKLIKNEKIEVKLILFNLPYNITENQVQYSITL